MTDEKQEEVGWDEAISGGSYVQLVTDESKKLSLKEWKLVKADKFGQKGVVEFQCNVITEDDEDVEKTFTTTSNRLKKKLKELLVDKDRNDVVTLTILPVGEKFDRQYSVKLVK